jgi:hypothetical protein
MWATTIFTIAALGLAASVAQGRAITEAPRNEMAARHMVREVVAEMSATPFSEVAAAFHGRSFDVPGLSPVAGDADGFAGEIAFAYGPDADAASYEVTVRVRWHDRTGDRQLETKIWLANVHGDTAAPPPLETLGKGGGQVPYKSGMSMGLIPLEEVVAP